MLLSLLLAATREVLLSVMEGVVEEEDEGLLWVADYISCFCVFASPRLCIFCVPLVCVFFLLFPHILFHLLSFVSMFFLLYSSFFSVISFLFCMVSFMLFIGEKSNHCV